MVEATAEVKKTATPVSSFVTTWITPINSIFLVTAAVVDFLTPRLGGQKSTVFLGLLVITFTVFFVWWFTGVKKKQGSTDHLKKAIASSVVVLGVALMLLYGKFAHAQPNGVLAEAVPTVVPMLQERLGVISADIKAVDTRLARMESTLNEIASPSDARLALTQRGIQFSPSSYSLLMERHDLAGLDLMLKAGMQVDEPDTMSLYQPRAFWLALDMSPKAADVLKVLVKAGFDPMKSYDGKSLWDRVVEFKQSPAVAAYLIKEHGALKVGARGIVYLAKGDKPMTMTALDWATRDITRNYDGGCKPADSLDGREREWLEMLVKAGASREEYKASMQSYMQTLNPAQQAQCEKTIALVAGLG